MPPKFKNLLFCNLLILFFLHVSPAQGGDRFLLKPFFETEYRLDTNFYKSDTEEREVTSLVFKPGLKFGFQTDKSSIELDAFLTDTHYDDQNSIPDGSKSSDENNFTGHDLNLSASTSLFTRIKTGIRDTWKNTRSPSEIDELANSVSINEFTINRVNPWLKYTISDRLAASLEYGNIDIDYAGGNVEDSSENRGVAKLYYSLSRFTTLDLEYQTWDMNYNMDSSDYSSDQYRFNVESQFKYFGFAAGIGFHYRDFDDPALEDMETAVWHLAIKGQTPQDINYPRPRSRFQLVYTENFNNTGLDDSYYTANRVTLTAGHIFMEKIDTVLSAYYQKSDYENDLQNRSDDTWFFSVALDYFTNEWLILSLETGYETRQSSLEDHDYDNRYILLKLNFNYNFGK